MKIIKLPARNYGRFDPLSEDKDIYVFRDLRRVCKVSEEDFCKAGGITVEELQKYEKMYFSEKEPAVRSLFDKPAAVYRKVLNLGIVPLFSYESDDFFMFLRDWMSAIDAHNFKEANEMRDQVSCFFEGAYDDLYHHTDIWRDAFLNEWVLMYMLYTARLLLMEDKIAEAGEYLEAVANTFEDIRSFGRWLPENMKYYYNTGYAHYHHKMKNYEKALVYYKRLAKLEAKMTEEQLQKAAYGHATALYDLGYYTQAREKLASFVTKSPKVGTPAYSINWLMGLLSAILGHYSMAEKLTMDCLVQAKKEESEFYICTVSHNLGSLYYLKGNYSYAPQFFDEALKRYTRGDQYYLYALYQKALCFGEMNKIDEFESLIAEGKELSKDNKTLTLLFETAACLLDIKNPESFDFLYSKALLVLYDESNVLFSIYYCDLLLKNIPDNVALNIEVELLRFKCKIMEKMYKGGEK